MTTQVSATPDVQSNSREWNAAQHAAQLPVDCPACNGSGVDVGPYDCRVCGGRCEVRTDVAQAWMDEVGEEGDEPTPAPAATIIAEASPADNAAGRYGAAAKASGPGGFDRAMLAACESLARQLGATPAGREMAASIGRAGRQAGTQAEFADLAADNPFADASYIEATAYDAGVL